MKMTRTRVLAVLGVAQGLLGCASAVDGEAQTETLATSAEAITGSWTRMNGFFPDGTQPGNVALLSDGRVLASGPETSNVWYTLTPDSTGSYANGTWTKIESSDQGRLFNPAFVLRDGRYVNCGGEYVLDSYEVRLHTPGTDRARCEIFDPVTESWSAAPSMPETVADSPAAELADGRILNLSHASNNSFLLTTFGVSPSWSSAASFNSSAIDSEGGCLLLPDSSAFCGNKQFQRYLPNSNSWVATATTPGLATGEFLPAPDNGEIGAYLLLHSGKVLVLGGNQHNGLYTPPTTLTGAGSWTLATDTPAPFNHADAPATVLPDGKAFTATTTDTSGLGAGAVTFFEYDPTPNAWTQVTPPPNVTFPSAERTRLLDLPRGNLATGQVLVTGTNDGSVWLYQPASTPQTAWKPTVTSVSAPNAGEFTLNGTQLNGLTTGADFGDDGRMATNYPIVSLTDTGGHVYYARSYNFDQMAPRKTTAGSCKFVLPTAIPNGSYQVHVSANGVDSSNTGSLTVSGRHVSSLSGPAAGANVGSSVTWTVTLSSAAPAGGAVVNLSSSVTSVATVPTSVTVPVGATSANFAVTTRGFGKSIISAVTAVANAQFKAATRKFGWTLETLGGPAMIYGSLSATWNVSLSNPAPASGINVNLTSSVPSAASVASTVTIPAGQTTASFVLTSNFVEGLTTITASLLNSSLDRVEATGELLTIGTMDFRKCADENGTCYVGDVPSSVSLSTTDPKLIAYGANGSYFFASGHAAVACNNTTFGDPAPGATKACYFAPYTFFGTEGASLAIGNHNVAYGANGFFKYLQIDGSFTCNAATFGDPQSGTTNSCYYGPGGYILGAPENGTLSLGTDEPVAYGGDGHFVFRVMSGSVSCSNTTFGDPAVGVAKNCYVFNFTYRADEGQPFMGSGVTRAYYGSGLNGAFLSSTATSGTCSNSFFNGDPDVGHGKHCYDP